MPLLGQSFLATAFSSIRCDVPKKITVSSDFCGYGTAVSLPSLNIIMALKQIYLGMHYIILNTDMCQALALHYLGVCFRTVMCSECDVDVAELLRCTHRYINQPLQPENFSADMVTRPHVEADLYIGTSPCKDFSTAGANKGPKPISHARFPAERACQRFVGRFRWQELLNRPTQKYPESVNSINPLLK